MKVADVMQTQVDYVTPTTPLVDVARLIFGHRINGVPVCKGRKLVGMVTEQDILDRFHPSMQDFVEDYAHARDFEAMEGGVKEVLRLPAEKVMSTSVTTIRAETPLLKAQSFMKVKEVGRLPVVDGHGNLVGIIAKGDIFKAVVGARIPTTDLERYHDFLSKYYDVFVEWNTRLSYELPNLVKLLKQKDAKRILDIGSGTGEHDLELAKKGFSVVGLDSSSLMIKSANQKKTKLDQPSRKRVDFLLSDLTDIPEQANGEFDAAIFLGNALPYLTPTPEQVLKDIAKALRKKSPLLVFQILNFEKVLHAKNRLLSFKIAKSKFPGINEHLFLEFYDWGRGDTLYHNLVVLDSYIKGSGWVFEQNITIPIRYVGVKEITAALKKAGFTSIKYYGTQGQYQGSYGPFPGERFKPTDHDWLNVVATR